MKIMMNSGRFYSKYGALAKQTSTEYSWWSDCKLLLHMDGVDTGTDFPDASNNSNVMTANGDAQTDTDQLKFGTASCYLDGNDSLSTPHNNDFNLTGPFTIDAYVRKSTLGLERILSHHNTPYAWNVNGTWALGLRQAGGVVQFNFALYSGGITDIYSADMGASWSYNVWHHVAMTRDDSNVVRFFLDGALVSEHAGQSWSLSCTEPLYVGTLGSGEYYNGWMDELRFVNGTAIWTAPFEVETEAYTKYEIGVTSTLPIRFDKGWTNTMYDNYASNSWSGQPAVLNPKNSSLLSYYKMEDTTDSKGSNTLINNGSIGFVAAKHNNGAYLNGSGKYFLTNPLCGGATTFIASFWINWNSLSGYQRIMQEDNAGAENLRFLILKNTDNTISFFARDSLVGGGPTLTYNGGLSGGVWYHFAIHYDTINDAHYLYVNGSLHDSDTTAMDPIDNSASNGMYLGTSVSLIQNAYATYDEVAFYKDITFSDDTERIAFMEALYNNGNGSFYGEENLKAAWTFDKDLLTDDSGNNHSLTNTGSVTLGSGKSNNGASFNGSNYLSTTSSSDFNFGASNFTMSVWVKPTSANSSYHYFTSKDAADVTNGLVLFGLNGRRVAYLSYNPGEGSWRYTPTNSITWDVWQLVTLTRVGSDFTIYINGESKLTWTNSNTYADLDADFALGAWPGHGNLYGDMDEVLIMKGTGLSQPEIQELYNNGEGRFYRKKFDIVTDEDKPWVLFASHGGHSGGITYYPPASINDTYRIYHTTVNRWVVLHDYTSIISGGYEGGGGWVVPLEESVIFTNTDSSIWVGSDGTGYELYYKPL